MSWLQVQGMNPPIPFGLRNYWKGHLVRETPAELADAVLEAIKRNKLGMTPSCCCTTPN